MFTTGEQGAITGARSCSVVVDPPELSSLIGAPHLRIEIGRCLNLSVLFKFLVKSNFSSFFTIFTVPDND